MTPLETYLAVIFTVQSLFIVDAHFDSITKNEIIIDYDQKYFNNKSTGIILEAINEFLKEEKLDRMVLRRSTSKNFSSYKLLNEESLFFDSYNGQRAIFHFTYKDNILSIISRCQKSDLENAINLSFDAF
jgi:hypothetical protein